MTFKGGGQGKIGAHLTSGPATQQRPGPGTRRNGLPMHADSPTQPAPSNRKPKPEKIGRRLYEVTHANGRTRSYFADIDMNGKQRRMKLHARNRTEARQAQAELLSKRAAGRLAVPSRKTARDVAEELRALYARQVASGECSPRTLEAYEYWLSRILAVIGDRPVQKVTAADVSAMIDLWRLEGRSAAGIAGARGPLNRLFSFALRRGYITENPLDRMEPGEWPRKQKAEKRILSLEEIRSLLAAATAGSRALIATLALSGLRQSEALGLTWADLDFEAGVLRVRHQLSRGANPRRVPLKTPAARRDVLLHPGLRDLLRKHKAVAFQRGQAKPEDLVFCTSSGKPYGQRNATRALAGAAERAGIEGLTTHALRHGFVSWLILELRLDPVRVAKQVGHTSAAFTLSTYSHAFEQAGHADELRKRMDESEFGRVLGAEA